MRNLKEDIGERIRLVRDRAGIGGAELGEILGVGKQAISNYEKGLSYPNPEGLMKIAETVKVSLDWLITGKAPPAKTELTQRDALKLAITSDAALVQEIREELTAYQPGYQLTTDERRLVENYRQSSEEIKETAIAILERSARKSRENEGGGNVSQEEKSA